MCIAENNLLKTNDIFISNLHTKMSVSKKKYLNTILKNVLTTSKPPFRYK